MRFTWIPALDVIYKKSQQSSDQLKERVITLDSGTYAATWEPGALESSSAATPGTLNRFIKPLEKSPASKNCISLVASRHATASSELNLIEGLQSSMGC